jgi:glutamate synthase domain-containing protein 3
LGQERNAHRVLVEKPAGKREFERRKRRCENRIKMNLKGIVGQAEGWVNRIQTTLGLL